MPSYLIQFSYAPETLATLIKRPEERGTVVNKLVKQIGGKLVGYWLSLGEYDGVVLVEGSDNIGAAACSMKVFRQWSVPGLQDHSIAESGGGDGGLQEGRRHQVQATRQEIGCRGRQ